MCVISDRAKFCILCIIVTFLHGNDLSIDKRSAPKLEVIWIIMKCWKFPKPQLPTK